MPIKGLTNRNEGDFPQIGAIRKGGKKEQQNGREVMGKELDHFRVEFDERETAAQEAFIGAYGPEPTEIVIVLPFNEIDRVWDAWNEAYIAGALIHRCDGEFVQYAVDPRTGEKTVANGHDVKTGECVKCSGGEVVYKYTANSGKEQVIRCRPLGRLKVIVPALRRLAYLMVTTTSKWDVIHISEQLKAIQNMNGGRIQGVPLLLRRKPELISTPSGEGGKRARRKKYLIHIEAEPRWVDAKLTAMQMASLPTIPNLPQLQAPAPLVPTSQPGPARTGELAGNNTDEDDDDDLDGEIVDDANETQDAPAVTPETAPAASSHPPMPEPAAPPAPQKPNGYVGGWKAAVINMIVKMKYIASPDAAIAALSNSNYITPADNDDVLTKWACLYSAALKKMPPSDAAKDADAKLKTMIDKVSDKAE